jgi:N-acetylgalactosamine-N,N'-diacetylbacillosaminyl-diphospho-undecaprenol 4-alpha-N-acetylgalactosaminyltransferase
MTQKKIYKICLISEQLATGGAERCAALLSQFFERKNINVHHVVVLDKIEYEFAGELLNLGIHKSTSNSIFNKLKRFWILRGYLKKHSFDYIIDFRVKNKQFQELIITKLIFNSPYVMTIHSYMTELYFPKWQFLARKIYAEAYGIVTVSEKIKERVAKELRYEKLKLIYNPISIEEIQNRSKEKNNLDFDYVLGVGRMDDNIKQFDKLITAYSKSVLPNHKIKLVLLGDGPFRKKLEEHVKILALEDHVRFIGWNENPFPYMKNAKLTVLSSKNEGFANVLLESLACQTPVVSFDCLSGPSEVITNRHNGLLVDNQNVEKLTQAMNLMIEDKELYQFCKQNALDSVLRFSLENIGEQWLKYLKIDVS